MNNFSGTITQILNTSENAGQAVDRLFPILYQQLQRIGARLLRAEAPGFTLTTTDLVNEAYIKLFDRNANAWDDRKHFFGVAAKAMRHILVDRARCALAQKRIPRDKLADLDHAADLVEDKLTSEVIDIDQALARLALIDPRRVEIVELRYFVGLTEQEVAEILGLSRATISREWRGARRWLHNELK